MPGVSILRQTLGTFKNMKNTTEGTLLRLRLFSHFCSSSIENSKMLSDVIGERLFKRISCHLLTAYRFQSLELPATRL